MRHFTPTTGVAVLLVLTTCGGEHDSSTTVSAILATSATSAGSETTGLSVSTSASDEGEHQDCLYRDDVLFVKNAPIPPADTATLVQLDVGGLAALLGVAEDDNDVAALGDLLDGAALTPYSVTNADPLASAVELEGDGFDAAPVLLTTITGHIIFAPGEPSDDDEVPEPTNTLESTFDPASTAAVVDTGYSETPGVTPAWLANRVEPATAGRDAESSSTPAEVAGHGKFVASIITQESPSTAVVVAGMSNLPPDTFYGDLPNAADTGFTTDEVQMYLAVSRLLNGNVQKEEFAVLNLSVGSYICPQLTTAPTEVGTTIEGTPVPPELGSGYAIAQAVELWNAEVGAPIVAAAGNHSGPDQPGIPFIPAAYGLASNVVAVASVDNNGDLSTFSNEVPAEGVMAFGENLIGVRMDDRWSSWSGSSFATAVVSAYIAANGVAPTPGTVLPLVSVSQN